MKFLKCQLQIFRFLTHFLTKLLIRFIFIRLNLKPLAVQSVVTCTHRRKYVSHPMESIGEEHQGEVGPQPKNLCILLFASMNRRFQFPMIKLLFLFQIIAGQMSFLETNKRA